jgi:hypothetical protein
MEASSPGDLRHGLDFQHCKKRAMTLDIREVSECSRCQHQRLGDRISALKLEGFLADLNYQEVGNETEIREPDAVVGRDYEENSAGNPQAVFGRGEYPNDARWARSIADAVPAVASPSAFATIGGGSFWKTPLQ